MAFALSDMQVTSPAFESRGPIPKRNAADGDDRSPELAWSAPPDGTKSLAVICHDPDAPLVTPGTYGFVHWVLYNLPASTTHLAEATQEGTVGGNDFGNMGYGGPMPPEGHGVHHYFFWVIALDRELDLEPGLTMWQFLERVEPHILGMNRIVGTYERG
ncbi:YbhB/YbcL family Raf kinase inhibitor-like protein [Halofilum ochraceum]|uniref:YbhB/YbcL family Raf kinase inhibitor-like protein n=1 Tax=Halofilum ochraceum TaxID=1611323 RepID=UPI0008D95DEF|nr:YbhB/YbcL family Raf kinase inhibitor-like protein [Halofilum ochraceum]